MTYHQPDVYARTGQWIVDTARRRPEALLLMAAGCALLLRSGSRPAGSVATGMARSDQSRDPTPSRLRGGLDQAAGTVSRYAGDVADKVSGTAKAYASNVADTVTDYAEAARRGVSDYAEGARQTATHYAEDARRNISETSDRLMARAESTYNSASEVIHEQPMLVVALGLAAGAAAAAFLPATEIERRTLGATRDAIVEKAAEAGESLLSAAGQAGERLKESVAERGLDSAGLKEMARDVAGTFTSAAAGKTEQDRSPGAGGTPPGKIGSGGASPQQTPSTKGNLPGDRSSGNVPGRT